MNLADNILKRHSRQFQESFDLSMHAYGGRPKMHGMKLSVHLYHLQWAMLADKHSLSFE